MENFLLAFVGLLVGVTATIIVGRYYFLRTVDKRLRVYIHFASPVLDGIDPAVRQVLKTYYRDVEVANLFQFQFLVANEGERAIRDLIVPLTLRLPSNVTLLDATILHIHPKERIVDISSHTENHEGVGATIVSCNFPLLNKREFFLAKLLLDGLLEPMDLDFYITADDLPPSIKAQYLPPVFTFDERAQTDWSAIAFGGFLLLPTLATFFATLVFILLRSEISALFPLQQGSTASSIAFWLCIVVLGVSSLVIFALALLIIVGIGLEGVFKRKPRFPLPSHLAARHAFKILFDTGHMKEKNDEKT